MASKRSEKPQRLGKLPPQHNFFLNLYMEIGVTSNLHGLVRPFIVLKISPGPY